MSDNSEKHDRRREISRGMVGLFKEFVGRGPTDAHTFINDGLVTVLLRDTLTVAEKTLAEGERAALVREVRRGFQGAMREKAIKLVQEQTGCRVEAFLSDNSVFPDYAVEVFVLDRPLSDDEDPADVYEVPAGLD
ncbi:MAG: DUF2294 domain-containing protein [Solirubrobacterales bacterium]